MDSHLRENDGIEPNFRCSVKAFFVLFALEIPHACSFKTGTRLTSDP
jgi:hypothetical protein